MPLYRCRTTAVKSNCMQPVNRDASRTAIRMLVPYTMCDVTTHIDPLTWWDNARAFFTLYIYKLYIVMGRGGLTTFRGCFPHTIGHICTNLMLKRFNSMSHIDNRSQNPFISFRHLAPSCAVKRRVFRRLSQVKVMLAPFADKISSDVYKVLCLYL